MTLSRGRGDFISGSQDKSTKPNVVMPSGSEKSADWMQKKKPMNNARGNKMMNRVDGCNFMYHPVLKQTEQACTVQILKTKEAFPIPDGAYWSDLKCVKLHKRKLL